MLEVKRSILLFDIYNINATIILYLLNPTKREELTIILQKDKAIIARPASNILELI